MPEVRDGVGTDIRVSGDQIFFDVDPTEFDANTVNGFTIVELTQAQYDALPSKDSQTIYIVV